MKQQCLSDCQFETKVENKIEKPHKLLTVPVQLLSDLGRHLMTFSDDLSGTFKLLGLEQIKH